MKLLRCLCIELNTRYEVLCSIAILLDKPQPIYTYTDAKYAIRKEGKPAGSAGSAGRQQRGQTGCAGNIERKQAALAAYGHKGRQAQAEKERREGSRAEARRQN
jgi:hypothetical protein